MKMINQPENFYISHCRCRCPGLGSYGPGNRLSITEAVNGPGYSRVAASRTFSGFFKSFSMFEFKPAVQAGAGNCYKFFVFVPDGLCNGFQMEIDIFFRDVNSLGKIPCGHGRGFKTLDHLLPDRLSF